MANYLMHRKRGWEMPGHKYISRYFKNGRWRYVYKDGKKYSKLADDWGKDEARRMFDATVSQGHALYELRNATDEDRAKKQAAYDEATRAYNKSVADYKKTPMGKLDAAGEKAAKKIEQGAAYLAKLLKKKKK